MFYLVYCTLPDGKEDVSVIPDTWLNENGETCVWPPSQIKADVASKMASKCSVPGSDWQTFPCRVVKAFDNYMAARQKLPLAAFTSDVSSDDESKRIPVKRIMFEPPIERRQTKKSRIDIPDPSPTLMLPTPPIQLGDTQSFTSQCLLVDVSELNSVLTYDPLRFDTASQYTQTEKHYCPDSELVTKLLKENINLKVNLVEMNNKLDWISTVLGANPRIEQQSSSKVLVIAEPFTRVEALEEFDAKLSTDSTLRKKLVEELWRLGGKNTSTSVFRMLDHIMTFGLGCKFSLHGKRGNHGFKSLNLFPVMCEAVDKHKWAKSVNATNLEDGISSWLRHCKPKLPKTGEISNEDVNQDGQD